MVTNMMLVDISKKYDGIPIKVFETSLEKNPAKHTPKLLSLDFHTDYVVLFPVDVNFSVILDNEERRTVISRGIWSCSILFNILYERLGVRVVYDNTGMCQIIMTCDIQIVHEDNSGWSFLGFDTRSTSLVSCEKIGVKSTQRIYMRVNTDKGYWKGVNPWYTFFLRVDSGKIYITDHNTIPHINDTNKSLRITFDDDNMDTSTSYPIFANIHIVILLTKNIHINVLAHQLVSSVRGKLKDVMKEVKELEELLEQ